MNILESFKPIKAFAFDVDGVLTNGQLLLTEDNQMLRSMNIKDGYALQLAIKKGYQVWTISGSRSEAVKNRLNKLDVMTAFDGVENKKQLLLKLCTEYNIPVANVLYMGDDIPDLEIMQICGLPCCPNDAVHEIREQAIYISPYKGGDGCVRDVIEKVMRLNGHWDLSL